MSWKSLIAAAAMVGMVGFAAEVKAGPGCKSSCGADKVKTTQAGGSCGSMQKSADKGGSCGTMAKGSGSCSMSGSAQCSMSAADCEKMLRAYYQDHGWLGAEMVCEDATVCQPKVTKVEAGSPAEAAGFRVGDLVTSMNGINYSKETEPAIQSAMDKGFRIGDTVTYTVQREGKITPLKATLVRIPDAAMSAMVTAHTSSSHKTGDKAENVQ